MVSFRKTSLAVLGFVTAAVYGISISGPSSTKYWVYGTSNQITWDYGAGDPPSVSITITNPQNDQLNGVFSIAENVLILDQSYTVTNVTLKPGPGYVCNLVNAQNTSDIYTSSSPFEVKAAGTAPYGATVFTVLSFSVQGTATKTFTIVETSLAPMATPSITGAAATSVASVMSTSAQAAATATAVHKSAASSIKAMGSIGALFVGVVAGVAVLL